MLKCPWHGSRFDVRTGENMDWVNAFAGIPMPKWTHGMISMGKAPAPLQTVPRKRTAATCTSGYRAERPQSR